MKTPAEFSKSISKSQITPEILTSCLYSSNKRAKNYRDKEREYRQYYRSHRFVYDKYGNEEKARNKKLEYYNQKEILLSVLTPTCIHKEAAGFERRRIYDYEEDYKKYANQFVWENGFYNHETEDYTYFGDILLKDKPLYRYYLFYEIPNQQYTFHTPIDESQALVHEKEGLPIIEIDELETQGRDIHDLLSNQFVKKVIELILSGQYTYIDKTVEEGKN